MAILSVTVLLVAMLLVVGLLITVISIMAISINYGILVPFIGWIDVLQVILNIKIFNNGIFIEKTSELQIIP